MLSANTDSLISIISNISSVGTHDVAFPSSCMLTEHIFIYLSFNPSTSYSLHILLIHSITPGFLHSSFDICEYPNPVISPKDLQIDLLAECFLGVNVPLLSPVLLYCQIVIR